MSGNAGSGFWGGRRVLVTGGGGFIGSALTRALVQNGADVLVVDNLSKPQASGNLSDVLGKIRFVQADLLEPGVAREYVRETEFCFHLAAKIGGIAFFHRYPASSVRDNTLINLNMWEAARTVEPTPKMVCVSSSMVFERANVFPTPEKALLTSPPPLTGYGFSKLAAEYIARTYFEEYAIPYVICRPFNAYGPGETHGEYDGYAHVVPDLIHKVLSRQDPLEILGDGKQTRSFTYVDDLADAMLTIAQKAQNDDYNIGTGLETSILELAKKIWALIWKDEEFRVRFTQGYPYDVKRRVPDVSKLRRLGWSPKVDLDTGLRNTIAYILHSSHG